MGQLEGSWKEQASRRLWLPKCTIEHFWSRGIRRTDQGNGRKTR